RPVPARGVPGQRPVDPARGAPDEQELRPDGARAGDNPAGGPGPGGRGLLVAAPRVPGAPPLPRCRRLRPLPRGLLERAPRGAREPDPSPEPGEGAVVFPGAPGA